MQTGNGLLGILAVRWVNLGPFNGLFDLMNCLFQTLPLAAYRLIVFLVFDIPNHSLFDTLLSAEVMAGYYALRVGLLTFLALGFARQTIAANLTPTTVQTGCLFPMAGDWARLDLHECGGWVTDMGKEWGEVPQGAVPLM